MGWSAWLTHERECAADGHAARAALERDPLGRFRRRLLRACRAHPRGRRPRSARDDGGLHPPGRRPVRDRRGEEPARARARRRRSRRDLPRSARRRRSHHLEGGRPPDPGALPPVRALRDGLPRDARPIDRLGDGRQRVRGGRQARTGDQLRCAPRPPGHHRRARLRLDRRRLRGRVDLRRGATRRPESRPGRCRTRSC